MSELFLIAILGSAGMYLTVSPFAAGITLIVFAVLHFVTSLVRKR